MRKIRRTDDCAAAGLQRANQAREQAGLSHPLRGRRGETISPAFTGNVDVAANTV